MTTREIFIGKKVLDFLHNEDGRQVHPMTIHAAIGGLNVCSVQEFDSTMEELNKSRFIIGITKKFGGMVWNISDAGEAARLEM